ncbi:hypothetical protein MBLNU230_g3181t1 [Neophaeotheca triangularis]
MIDPTLPQLLQIRLVIHTFQAIPILSILTTTYALLTHLLPTHLPRLPLPLSFQIYTSLETLHQLLLTTLYLPLIQKPASHPPLRSRQQRQELFNKVTAEVEDLEGYILGWFKFPESLDEVSREGVGEFIAWAIFEGRVGDGREEKEELEGYVRVVEARLGRGFRFREGGRGVQGLRLTIDPVLVGGVWGGRCLLWWGILGALDVVTAVRMRWVGFGFWRRKRREGWAGWVPRVWPLRMWTLLPGVVRGGGESAVEGFGYWYRPHTSTRRAPVLFLHGIGVGLHPHVDFFGELDKALNGKSSKKTQDHLSNDAEDDDDDDGQVGILALEILPISSRITSPVLRRAAFLTQLTELLDAHSPAFDSFILASHSYGSILSTHILAHPPLAARLSGLLLIDPVSILLHLPHVAYNFTARPPTTANEWQLWFFASKDFGVAWTLGRHFFWSENCLWREDLERFVGRGGRVTVSLAGRDLIVDSGAVGRYLVGGEKDEDGSGSGSGNEYRNGNGNGHQKSEEDKANGLRKRRVGDSTERKRENGKEAWKERQWKGRGLEVLWFDNFDHAQVFDTPQTKGKLIQVLREYCKYR